MLGFSKAFDLIDHTILLQKLSNTNFPQILINWIRSFLATRQQRIRLNGCISSRQTVNRGVPQGTVFGPILFVVMINDLLFNWSDRWQYVDDRTVTETIPRNCCSNLQELVNEISDWTI